VLLVRDTGNGMDPQQLALLLGKEGMVPGGNGDRQPPRQGATITVP
jgi:hypothetical protein